MGKYSKEIIDKIIKLNKEGYNTVAIAKILGVSKTVAYALTKEN